MEKINAELTAVQDRYFKANQEGTEARLRVQSLENSVIIEGFSTLS